MVAFAASWGCSAR